MHATRDLEDKKKGPHLRGRPQIVLCELNQVAGRMGSTPRSFPRMSIRMGIALDMMRYGALWFALKDTAQPCIAFLPL